jgi:hypothetical protein
LASALGPNVLRLAFVIPFLPIRLGPIPPSQVAKKISDGARMNGVKILRMAGLREWKSPVWRDWSRGC